MDVSVQPSQRRMVFRSQTRANPPRIQSNPPRAHRSSLVLTSDFPRHASPNPLPTLCIPRTQSVPYTTSRRADKHISARRPHGCWAAAQNTSKVSQSASQSAGKPASQADKRERDQADNINKTNPRHAQTNQRNPAPEVIRASRAT